MQNLSPKESAKRFKIIQYKVREKQIGDIWQKFEEAGFQPILIKGWAAAQCYPKPFEREFVDIDLIVNPDGFLEADEFSKIMQSSLPIDLHYGPRHLDSLSFEDIFENSVFYRCGEIDIRVPRAEDHLRMLCIHWLTDGGANREKLKDIYYLIDNRTEEFDWDRFLNVISHRRQRWLECAVGTAQKYLKLNLENTPLINSSENLPKWFVQTIQNEWNNSVKLEPLQLHLRNKKMLWKQIKKRLPPNPIQATVLQEGDFDWKPRIWYQIGNIFNRLPSLLKSIKENLSLRKS